MKKQYKIFILDDDKNIRRMIEVHLKKDKIYESMHASNGESCLKILQEEVPDLILLDIQMPGIDGIETLEQIKQQYSRIPIIMMSAHGTIDIAVRSMKLGAYDFITKPFSGDRLNITVRNALESNELRG